MSAETDELLELRRTGSADSLAEVLTLTSIAESADNRFPKTVSKVGASDLARLLHPSLDERRLSDDELLQVLACVSGSATTDGPPLETLGGRRYARLFRTRAVEAWVIAWGSSTYLGLHDHGGSSAAYQVIAGSLSEASTALTSREPLTTTQLQTGTHRVLGPRHVHELWNPAKAPAVSIHVYSPPLRSMSYYSDQPSNFLAKVRTETESQWPDPEHWAERAVG